MRSIKSLKLLLVSVSLERKGGVSQYVLNLKEHFNKTDLIAEHFSQEGFLINMIYFILALKKGRYDVVHFNPSLGPRALLRDFVYSMVAIILGFKTLFFIHGWDENTYVAIKSSTLYTILFAFMINRQEKVVVLDHGYKEKLTTLGCVGNKIFVSSTMVNSVKYIQEAMAKNDDDIVLVFCSRIEKEKGVFHLLDALDFLPEEVFQRIRLIYVGIGGSLEQLKKTVVDKGFQDKVEIKGFVSEEEKIKIYLEGDIFMFPSFHGEGFPTVILEAMAAGLPIITTDIGGTKRAVEDGINGFYLSSIPPSPEDIAQKISMVLESDIDKISRDNIKKVKQLFDSDVVVGRLVRLYEAMAPEYNILLVGPLSPTGGVGGMLASEYELLQNIDGDHLEIFDIQSLKENPLNLIKLFRKLITADLTHIHCSFATVYSSFQLVIPLFLSKITFTKTIITYHRGEPAPYFESTRSFSQLLFSFPDVITVPSEKQKDILLKYDIVKSRKIYVLYNFIKNKYLLESRSVNLLEKKDYVITTGEISKANISRKGFDDFVKLAREMEDIEFYLVGNIEGSQALRLKENGPPNLHMPGFISESELSRFYRSCKVYLQLSRSESFGVSMVEAMCFDCVPIIYNRGALPEVIDGEGYTVRYKDVEAVKNNILRVILGDHDKDPKRVVMERYTPGTYLKKFKSILNEVC